MRGCKYTFSHGIFFANVFRGEDKHLDYKKWSHPTILKKPGWNLDILLNEVWRGRTPWIYSLELVFWGDFRALTKKTGESWLVRLPGCKKKWLEIIPDRKGYISYVTQPTKAFFAQLPSSKPMKWTSPCPLLQKIHQRLMFKCSIAMKRSPKWGASNG